MNTLINIDEVSSTKRINVLQNLFFHDILNRLGGLNGIIQLIKAYNKQPALVEYIDMLDTIVEMAIEDIQTQRYLETENNQYILNIHQHRAMELVDAVYRQIAFHPVINTRHLKICTSCADFTFETDATLVKRILLNMAKNAAEASPVDGSIYLSCKKKVKTAVFTVNNQGTIPEEIQKHIFKKTYSTKGPGRGLGTHSMKVFGENYLKGKVYFMSDEKTGTTFVLELPLK